MIFVTARMDARPGQHELLEQAAKALVAPTAAEQGCIAYEPVSYTHLTLPTIYSV